jgi:hypothetical protein
MFLKRALAASAPVITALALGASAGAATTSAADPVVTGPSCPDGYAGPTNLATGCPYWLMSYSVQYPGQPAYRCAPNWSPPPASPGVGAPTGSGRATADPCAAGATPQ